MKDGLGTDQAQRRSLSVVQCKEAELQASSCGVLALTLHIIRELINGSRGVLARFEIYRDVEQLSSGSVDGIRSLCIDFRGQ